ncbi:Hsp20 family protein [Candidatus Methylospira mobilis]|uniref:Hsp20 family protein n=1 Tax=Candidatus Methylospira mobilis TaxID=1808979 RepID=A0A5Q0BLY3_9GAMM|nr:Hsp20 family protein [Candidatus Methylospira mobilis]
MNPLVSNSLFDELFRGMNPGYFVKPLHGDPLPAQIKMDVKENPGEFIIHAEIPGASKENIHVDIDGEVISIRAQISQIDSSNKDEKTLRTERYYGEVSRSFKLSSEIDEQASKAAYDNGVLTLNLAKKQKKSGQRLTVA